MTPETKNDTHHHQLWTRNNDMAKVVEQQSHDLRYLNQEKSQNIVRSSQPVKYCFVLVTVLNLLSA